MFKNWRTSFERIEKYLSDTYFTDVNLSSLVIVEESKLVYIDHLKISTNPGLSTEESLDLFDNSALKFESVSNFSDENWEKVDVESFTFGFTWSIHWFRVRFHVPSTWFSRPDHSIELHWDSGCEVLVFTESGRCVIGLNSTHHRTSINIAQLQNPVDSHFYTLFLQISCSDLFGAGEAGLINAPSTNKLFKIELACLRLLNRSAILLGWDLRLLMQLAESLKDTDIGHRALYRANEAINLLADLRTSRNFPLKLAGAQDLVERFFMAPVDRDNSSGVDLPTMMTLHAIGHCHIDTAWLWRYGETRRKIVRSWACTLRLLEQHEEMRFVCSQAQQLAWLLEDHPGLFEELRAMARAGRFVPVGATWVEMDANLPCCESLCRQFLLGQRFFRRHFGAYCSEFWLPDTFGYPAQLPQIMRLGRVARFVTQKLSWSLVNKFPHHSFFWAGLDGSRVLSHFPPGDSYAMRASVAEIVLSANNFKDKGRSSHAMFVYGHGDGGQGPTEEMLHALNRLSRAPGLPRIVHSSPSAFFERVETEQQQLEASGAARLCSWHGELFLELHNGTYTSQRQLKVGNAHCEQMLRAVELLTAIAQSDTTRNLSATMVTDFSEQLERQWEAVLLGQFHDVLPGSSIEQVNEDAWCSHRSVLAWCRARLDTLTTALGITAPFLVNPTSWPLLMPVDCKGDSFPPQLCLVGAHSVRAVPGVTHDTIGAPLDSELGDVRLSTSTAQRGVTYRFDEEHQLYLLANRHLEISVDEHCRIRALHTLPSLGNLIPEERSVNQLMLFDDVPLFWDAWDVMDYHLETGIDIQLAHSYELLEAAHLVGTTSSQSVTLRATMKLVSTGTLIETSISVLEHLQYVSIVTKVLEWRETHRLLKVQIPTRALAMDAQYRTQGGYLSRPTHSNTSWDAAKFEVCGHDWVHVGEANWGVSVLKDAIFGCSVVGGAINLSLLRAPTAPDAHADKTHLPHVFHYAIYPYRSSATESHQFATTTRLATQFSWLCAWTASRVQANTAVEAGRGSVQERSFPITLASPERGEVAIDWIKPSCEDASRVVIRLHEQVGGRFPVRLVSRCAIAHAQLVDILEERDGVWGAEDVNIKVGTHSIDLFLMPFRIVSVLVGFH